MLFFISLELYPFVQSHPSNIMFDNMGSVVKSMQGGTQWT